MWTTLLALGFLAPAQAAASPHVSAKLSVEAPSVPAGGEAKTKLTLEIDKGWHIYPVDFEGAGIKTTIEPKAPSGVTLLGWHWPAVKMVDLFGTATPVHEGTVTVEGSVAVAATVAPGTYEMGANVHYQACSNVCIEGTATPTAQLVVTAADPTKSAAAAPANPANAAPLTGELIASPEVYDNTMSVAFELADAALGPGEATTLTVRLSIAPGWHSYSPKSDPGGQVPLALRAEGLELVGELAGPEPTPHIDHNLKITLLEYSGDVTLTQTVRAPKGGIVGKPTVTLTGQACDVNSCKQPGEWTARFDLKALAAPRAGRAPRPSPSNGGGAKPNIPAAAAGGAAAATAGSLASLSLAAFLLTSALGGWASLFTPCVFPMVPITVSFFSKRAAGKRGRAVLLASTYALGIIATFTLIGVVFSLFFGAASLANFATNVWVNLGMGVLFVVLGLSLLGLFNIAAPSGLTNKIEDARGEAKNDLVMTLLMAIAFTLASFTCTVPVLGALLGLSAAGGSIARPVVGMLAYSAAFAAPFFLLALFPTSLQRLPKGGAWLEVMKVSMGIVEIAAALKFLSNADIGGDTQVLTRPVFLVIWIALFLALALYLFGILRLPGSEGEVGAIRALFGIGSLAFGLYLFMGLFGLRYGSFLESFLPPDGYGGQSVVTAGAGNQKVSLSWLQTLEEGREIAKKENRRLFLNFTGDQCINCRGMEQGFFPRPEVAKELERFVRVELWLDRTSTPELAERSKRYFDYEIKKFDTSARPFYVIMEPDGETVVATYPGATTSKEEDAAYLAFLRAN
jgi:thiol:disulfide interchange protein DsbD